MPIVEGTLTQHMAAHILAMNLIAPVCAAMVPRSFAWLAAGGGLNLAAATTAQAALLWAWHLPPVLTAAMTNTTGMVVMHGSLFAVAFWFWSVVLDQIKTRDFKPVAALLITGKLVCLLGVLLAFAPRTVYWQLALFQSCYGPFADPLADQQMAGLLMLVACPIVFVGVAIVAARRWLRHVDANLTWRPRLERV